MPTIGKYSISKHYVMPSHNGVQVILKLHFNIEKVQPIKCDDCGKAIFLKNAHWMSILNQFRKENSHSIVMIVVKLFLTNTLWILNQFMKERSSWYRSFLKKRSLGMGIPKYWKSAVIWITSVWIVKPEKTWIDDWSVTTKLSSTASWPCSLIKARTSWQNFSQAG